MRRRHFSCKLYLRKTSEAAVVLIVAPQETAHEYESSALFLVFVFLLAILSDMSVLFAVKYVVDFLHSLSCLSFFFKSSYSFFLFLSFYASIFVCRFCQHSNYVVHVFPSLSSLSFFSSSICIHFSYSCLSMHLSLSLCLFV